MDTPVSLVQRALAEQRIPDRDRARVKSLIQCRADLMDEITGIDDELAKIVQK